MNELTTEQLEQLRKPFPAKAISFKCQTKPNEKGNSLVVAYIDARDVMDRLDDTVGPNWGDRYEPSGTGKGLVCYLTVGDVTRADVGDTDNENEPTKTAYSDAFKRAAVKFGIGRFLYDLPKMWAKAKPMGKSFILEDGEIERLRRGVDDFLAGKKQSNKRPEADSKTGEIKSTANAGKPAQNAQPAATQSQTGEWPAKVADAGDNPDPVPDAMWKSWKDLTLRAGTANVKYANVDRAKITAHDLGAAYNELLRFVKDAERQAKAVDPA